MKRGTFPRPLAWAKLLGIGLVVATLANGGGAYFKRIGVADPAAYRFFWAVHCAARGPADVTEWQCDRFTTPEERLPHAGAQAGLSRWESIQYVFEVPPVERPLKLLKDVFWVVLLAIGAYWVAAQRPRLAGWRACWPLLGLAAYTSLALAFAIPLNGLLLAAAGLRSFLFLGAALLGGWLAPQVQTVAVAVAALVAIQAVLVSFELVWGIHMFHEWGSLASRAAGTLVQPNSLGVFAVTAFAFWHCFTRSRRFGIALGLATAMLVVLSGSGTGLICMALALAALAIRRMAPRWRLTGGLAVIAATAIGLGWLLPLASGRADVFDSVIMGRWSALAATLAGSSWAELILGSGLGVNTNLALSLGMPGRPTDSMLIGLLVQLGLVGAALFYASLWWAARRDHRARPFYAVVGLCTLTINVSELFPVNVLLALALAHSLWQPTSPAEHAGAD